MPHTPEGLYAIIAARLDTLSTSHRALIQDAAVVGKVFWAGALASMGGVDRASVDEALHALSLKEIVRPSKVSSIASEAEYLFWHALIRDVAYGQIHADAAPKHVAAAAWIERIAGERVSDQAELLAHHYGEALELSTSAGATQDLSSLEDTTRRWWVVAGERAMMLDVVRAGECFDRALALTPPGHPDRADIFARNGAASYDAGRYQDAEAAYEQALGLYREAGDLLGVGTCLDRLATVLWEEGNRGEPSESRRGPPRPRGSAARHRARRLLLLPGLRADRLGPSGRGGRLGGSVARAVDRARRRALEASGARVPGSRAIAARRPGRRRRSGGGAPYRREPGARPGERDAAADPRRDRVGDRRPGASDRERPQGGRARGRRGSGRS